MKVSYPWLQEYFDEPLPKAEELAELLTFHSFEIEGVVGEVIDVDVLPNRSSDCLSHRGIAKELSVLLDRPLTHDSYGEPPQLGEKTDVLKVTVDDTKLCPRFSALMIKGVTVGPSPDWLRERLEALGQKSINNIVDITNYVMFDLGQPLHAFGRENLKEEDGTFHIRVRSAHEGEKIETLDGAIHTLDPNHLLITDGHADAPLGIAGVKGGEHSGVSEETTAIVLEAAHFDPASVRKTSQALKLQTDASTRFQNNPSRELTVTALSRAAKLIEEIAGGTLVGHVDAYPEREDREPVSVSLPDINSLLGTTLSENEVRSIFDRFGWEYTHESELFTVTPAFERSDINIKEDLIEEVGRVFGYSNIKGAQLPPREGTLPVNKNFYYAEKVRNVLTGLGFDEVYTYTLRDTGEVELLNSLASDKTHMRASLADGLQESLDLNTYNAPLLGLDEVKLFEIGPVFEKGGEHTALGIALRNLKGKQGRKEEAVAKEAEDALSEALGKDSAFVLKDGVAELNFDSLIDDLPEPEAYETFEKPAVHKYETISPYPFLLRDIAVWIPKDTESSDVEGVIREEAGELLVHIKCFDTFEKDDRVSYAYNLVFQSEAKTLSDAEINEVMEKITKSLNQKGGFSVR